MTADVHSLLTVYKGWDGYQVSLVRAIAPLSREQLAYRPASHLRSAGEIARHISEGRFGWFQRTFGVSSTEAANLVVALVLEGAELLGPECLHLVKPRLQGDEWLRAQPVYT